MEKKELRRQLDAWFAVHYRQMLSDISKLVKIPSIRQAPLPGKPFGQDIHEALQCAKEIAQALHFHVRDVDGYVLTADLNEKKPRLALIGHLDVVKAGDGWTYPPFQATEDRGYLYGRGTADNKGPLVAALYAARAAGDLCPELPSGVQVILGTAEESTCEDMRYYMARHTIPPMSFSPDADYPVINAEKAIHAPRFRQSWKEDASLPRVLSIHGGTVKNAVPGQCRAELEGFTEAELEGCCRIWTEKLGVAFSVGSGDRGPVLTALGKSAHACEPEKGVNAQTALIALLSSLPLADSPGKRAISRLNRLFPFGDTAGEALGIACGDEATGPLTVTFSVLELNGTGFTAQYDSRGPLGATQASMAEPALARLRQCGFEVFEGEALRPGHYVSAESVLCKTLNRIYEENTGLPGGCRSIGGYTYAHDIPGSVAFGCAMPGADPRFHGADERMDLADLVLSAKMFALAIMELCRETEDGLGGGKNDRPVS